MAVEWEAVIDADCPVPIAWRHTRRYWLSRIRDEIGRVEKERDELAAENAKLKAVVEAARWLRVVELQRAKIGMTYGAETQNIAERDLDAALSALDVKGGG